MFFFFSFLLSFLLETYDESWDAQHGRGTRPDTSLFQAEQINYCFLSLSLSLFLSLSLSLSLPPHLQTDKVLKKKEIVEGEGVLPLLYSTRPPPPRPPAPLFIGDRKRL